MKIDITFEQQALVKRACDMAAALSIPNTMITSSFNEQYAGDEVYNMYCMANANKIVLYLHTWTDDYQQIKSMPEFLGIQRACIVSPNFNGRNNTPSSLGSTETIEKINLVLQEVMYKTGLSRIYILAASGGTLAAMNYMGTYPGKVHRASLWLPIYDLFLLYSTTSDTSLKNDMISAIGHPPENSADIDYLKRSPRSCLMNTKGPTTVFINVGTLDTTSIPKHGIDAFSILSTIDNISVAYKEWNIGHIFGPDQRKEAIKQLILE